MDSLISSSSLPHFLRRIGRSWSKRQKSLAVSRAAKAWLVVGQTARAVGGGPCWGETTTFWKNSRMQGGSCWSTSTKMLVSSLCCLALASERFVQGTLDLLVQRTGEQGQGNVWFVQNNFYYDAFFLKAIGKSPMNGPYLYADTPSSVLNGGCPSGWCSPPNGSRFHVCLSVRPLCFSLNFLTAIWCELLWGNLQVHGA